jgi:hypothetical protein
LEKITQRSISHEFALQAKENLRVLRLQKKIAEQIVNYAHYRLTRSVESGEISEIASKQVASRLHHDLNSINREYDRHQKIVQLYILEASQDYLVQEFNNLVTELDEEIAIIHEALRDYSDDITRVRSYKPRNISKFLLLIIIPLIVLLPFTFGLLSAQSVTNSSGIVASVDLAVYQDADCSQVLETLDWGTICPGQNITNVVFVMNSGNVNMTIHLDTSNWNPSEASGYISLNWDPPPNNLLSPGLITPLQISLSVSDEIQIVQAFTFDIVLTSNPIP